MQTFFPSPNFNSTAQLLDSKRLNKQILEGYQILKVLSTNGKAWRNHPAVLMWEKHERVLLTYIETLIQEARSRDIGVEKNVANLKELEHTYGESWGTDLPRWFEPTVMARVNITHQANLHRKDAVYYAQFLSAVTDSLNRPCCVGCLYFWPTHPRGTKRVTIP